mmetsp:Transcript_33076/g.69437  ORF Transcript_33076/g.69437 Transcript_33076/m.69437 type:complete len:330 (-) Transcript_33076:1266-2255(-)
MTTIASIAIQIFRNGRLPCRTHTHPWRTRQARSPHLWRQRELSPPTNRKIRRRTQCRPVPVLILVGQSDAQCPALLRVYRTGEGRTPRRHEVRPPRPHDESLPVLVVGRPRPFDDDEDGGHGQLRQRDVLAGVATDDHDLELARGRRVPHYPIVAVRGSSGVDGRSAHTVREHAHEVVNVLELGSESRAHDVVAAGHALDDLPRDVRVRLVGRHVEALAGSDEEVVEQEGGHGAGVSGELLGETQDGAGALSLPRRLLVGVDVVAALLLLQSLEQDLELRGGRFLGTAHEAFEEGPERLPLVVLVLAAEEDPELGLVGNAGGELRVLLD